MKKIITILLTAALIITMAVPAFADDSYAAAKPAKVQALKVAKNGYKSLKISWQPADGAVKYQVYRSKTGKTGSFALKFTTTKTTYNNTAVTCGTTYYYKVRAVAADGTKGAFSEVKSNKVQPSTVKITKVNCIDEWEVRINWNKIAGASGYQVYRSKKGADNWKLFKTVSSKYNYATNYLAEDTKYTIWEWKVRAYRTVNGKKVYGYFSVPAEWKPDWTIDEIYEELWKYGESLEWTEYEWIEGKPNPDEWAGRELWPTGRKYHFKHFIGANYNSNGTWETVYTNPANGTTQKNNAFEQTTPDGSSWTVSWPERISYYDTKESIIKRLKPIIKSDMQWEHHSNPVYWDPYLTYDGETFGGYNGTEGFCLYMEKERNSYKIWLLW